MSRNRVSALLVILAVLLVATHPFLALAVELAALAVIAAGIASAAGAEFRIPWRTT